jgi:hypothetical protein
MHCLGENVEIVNVRAGGTYSYRCALRTTVRRPANLLAGQLPRQEQIESSSVCACVSSPQLRRSDASRERNVRGCFCEAIT